MPLKVLPKSLRRSSSWIDEFYLRSKDFLPALSDNIPDDRIVSASEDEELYIRRELAQISNEESPHISYLLTCRSAGEDSEGVHAHCSLDDISEAGSAYFGY